jgi:hypothetical protein
MKLLSPSQIGRAILFVVALAILFYEFVIGPKSGKSPDTTIVISAIILAATTVSLKLDLK